MLCDTHDTTILIVDTYVTIPVSPRSRYIAIYRSRQHVYRNCICLQHNIYGFVNSFYHTKLCVARYCQGKLSVRLSPSVTLRYCDRVGWNSAKIISRLISLTISLSADHNMTDLLQRNTQNFSWNRRGVGKIVNFRHLIRRISEMVQHRVQVAIDH